MYEPKRTMINNGDYGGWDCTTPPTDKRKENTYCDIIVRFISISIYSYKNNNTLLYFPTFVLDVF